MNIFTRKKQLFAEIANLEEQIRIQSREMDKLRTANTGLNELWLDTKKKAKQFGEERESLKEELRARGIEYAAELGKKNRQIEDLTMTNSELNDVNAGLASSVSDLKAKLLSKSHKVVQLTAKLDELKDKQKNAKQ